MPDKSAALISARELPRLVDAAIKAAGDHGIASNAMVTKWDLVGRMMKDMASAEKLAAGVAAHINAGAGGHKVSSAVLKIDDRILAGFYERVAIPQFREF